MQRQRHIRPSIKAFMTQKEHKSNEYYIISMITQRRINECDGRVLSEATSSGNKLAVQIYSPEKVLRRGDAEEETGSVSISVYMERAPVEQD